MRNASLNHDVINDEAPVVGRRTRVLISLAVVTTALAVFTIGSLALFSDQVVIGGDGIGTGTVDLTASPASAVVRAPRMQPGDQITSTIDIINGGSLELRYTATTTTTEDTLASQLRLTIKVGVTHCDDAGWADDGTVIFSGSLGASDPSPLFGDPASGSDPGDRTLPAGASDQLCLNVALPIAASSGLQGRTTSATFDFVAEQTVNNP